MYFKYGCVIELVSATYMLVILDQHALWIEIKRVWKWNKGQAYPHMEGNALYCISIYNCVIS